MLIVERQKMARTPSSGLRPPSPPGKGRRDSATAFPLLIRPVGHLLPLPRGEGTVFYSLVNSFSHRLSQSDGNGLRWGGWAAIAASFNSMPSPGLEGSCNSPFWQGFQP